MPNQPLRIGIVAGETSGDLLAAGLIQWLRKAHPDAVIEGIAGPNMLAQGCHSLFDMEELSVMGLVEVLSRIRRLLFIRKSVYQYFRDNPPDVFIGVDAPDFNLALEKKLKRLGIKTVHYVSPTVWAWRENRIFGIGAATHLVLSIFPFEQQIYAKHHFPCHYVGHTLADAIPLEPDKTAARQQLDLNSQDKVLALLPGSRGGEVKTLLDTFMHSTEILAARLPGLKVLVPAANQARYNQIHTWLAGHKLDVDIQLLSGQARAAMIAADAVLLASGTAALEAMLCKRPMVVAYLLKWLTHQMMKFMYKQDYFALPNILAGRALVPELLQEQVNPENIANLLYPLLSGEQQQDMEHFAQLHQVLRKNADKQAADAVLALLEE